MNITFCNTNENAVYLCVDGDLLMIAPYSSETVSCLENGTLNVVLRIRNGSYTEKRKGSILSFSFYHDYHLALESAYRLVGVQDGDVFDITEEAQQLLDPDGVIYERAVLHPRREIAFDVDFRVLGDQKQLKKQYRKDNFKNGLFDFFVNPLVGGVADGCSPGCGATLLFWAIVIVGIVKFGFMAVLKWVLVIYLALAVLEWAVTGFLDYIGRGGKTKRKAFDTCFDPRFIGEKFRSHDFASESKKHGFFGKKK